MRPFGIFNASSSGRGACRGEAAAFSSAIIGLECTSHFFSTVAKLHYSGAKRLWIILLGLAGIGGVSMWNERKMPERWYGLLRQRMQVEEQRMGAIRDGDIIAHDDLAKLMAQAESLDREMLLVMRQAIAGAIEANASAASLRASAEWRAGLSHYLRSDFA